MSQKTWEINALSLELDMEDAEVQERYENAFELFEEERKQIPKDGKLSEITKSSCSLFEHLFDRIFGDGTSEKIFSGVPIKLSEYIKIYNEFVKFANQRMNEANASIKEAVAKYRPNRRQRRSKKK